MLFLLCLILFLLFLLFLLFFYTTLNNYKFDNLLLLFQRQTTGEKSKETKNWLSDFLKKEGIEKLADEQPDDKQIENKSKYLQNRNGRNRIVDV